MTAPNQTAFEKDVTAAFNFLVEQYGYSVHIDAAGGAVVFTDNALLIRVFREPGSYMIYVEVVRRDTGEEYLLHEILRALAPEEALTPQCSGADATKMKSCVDQLSQLCQQHLQNVLAMDESTFEKVAESAKEISRRYTLEAEYGAIKDRANVAWERKDWDKARELYEEAKPGLSTAEKRRLDFLVKKSL